MMARIKKLVWIKHELIPSGNRDLLLISGTSSPSVDQKKGLTTFPSHFTPATLLQRFITYWENHLWNLGAFLRVSILFLHIRSVFYSKNCPVQLRNHCTWHLMCLFLDTSSRTLLWIISKHPTSTSKKALEEFQNQFWLAIKIREKDWKRTQKKINIFRSYLNSSAGMFQRTRVRRAEGLAHA